MPETIFPTAIVKTGRDVITGDYVLDDGMPYLWRPVQYVSHDGLGPDQKRKLHFSPGYSRVVNETEKVIVGFYPSRVEGQPDAQGSS